MYISEDIGGLLLPIGALILPNHLYPLRYRGFSITKPQNIGGFSITKPQNIGGFRITKVTGYSGFTNTKTPGYRGHYYYQNTRI